MRYKNKQLTQARKQGFVRYLAREDARRLALPPRPDEPAPGLLWRRVTVEGPGVHWVMEVLYPPDTGRYRPRSDQFTVVDGGVPAAKLEGKTALLKRIAAQFPRLLSRSQRDEIDRIPCGATLGL